MAPSLAGACPQGHGDEPAHLPMAVAPACPCDRIAILSRPDVPGPERQAAVRRARRRPQAHAHVRLALPRRPDASGTWLPIEIPAHRVSRPDPCYARHATRGQSNAGRTACPKASLVHHVPHRDPRVRLAARRMRGARGIDCHKVLCGRHAWPAPPCVRRALRPYVRHGLHLHARFVRRCWPCAS